MKRLFIDLEKCDSCSECVAKCSYIYHPQNQGITSLRELATFFLVCRKCEEAPCINACYRNALKKEEGIIKRARFLCTSCKSCSLACPFGTIFVDFLTFLDSKCDFCISRQKILCIESCPYQAIEIREIQEDLPQENIYIVSERLAVHAQKWFKDDKAGVGKK